MRMRELERQTGVGRETIRYYIREGLLPEPERASRNSAFYSDEHVARIRAIKRLQEERFLPLSLIKTLLDAADSERWLHSDSFPHLDVLLRDRLDTGGARVAPAELCAQLGCSPEEFGDALAIGMLRPGADGRLDARDAAILRILMQLRDIGFTRERGWAAETMRLYVEIIDWVVGREVEQFFDHTAGLVPESEAADMAERGVALVNDLLSQLRTREILRRLEARRKIANDNN